MINIMIINPLDFQLMLINHTQLQKDDQIILEFIHLYHILGKFYHFAILNNKYHISWPIH